MEVINELLGYPLIKIIQETDGFSFSLDSMLLGEFVTLKPGIKEIIDIGCGNAPIPLYLTLRTNAKILGVEIQEKSYDLAKRSILLNNKEDQITIINEDARGISKKLRKKFDCVVSNPPFFKVHEKSRINDSDLKTIARHEVMLTLEELVYEASKLLNDGGVFAMVHRPDRLTDILVTLREHDLEPKRLRFVYPKPNTKPNHVLVEAVKGRAKGGLICLEPLYAYDENGNHTSEVLTIYNKKSET